MDYMEQYRNRSLVIGKQVARMSFNKSPNAVVFGIDDKCHLLARYSDGTEDCYSSGEISVKRPAKGEKAKSPKSLIYWAFRGFLPKGANSEK